MQKERGGEYWAVYQTYGKPDHATIAAPSLERLCLKALANKKPTAWVRSLD